MVAQCWYPEFSQVLGEHVTMSGMETDKAAAHF